MLTQKQENFCTAIVLDCMTQHDAYIKAYNTEKMLSSSIDEKSCLLAGEGKIKSRIHELRAETKSKKVASEIERKEILSEILRGKLSQFSDDTGVIDRSKLDSHAIQGVEQLEVMGRSATVLKVKLHSPIQAIAELNKMEGIYAAGPVFNDNRVINILVKDQETKEIMEGMVERTKEMEIGGEDG